MFVLSSLLHVQKLTFGFICAHSQTINYFLKQNVARRIKLINFGLDFQKGAFFIKIIIVADQLLYLKQS